MRRTSSRRLDNASRGATALVKADEAPTTWKDLLGERWSTNLGIAQAGAGGSALALTRFQRDVLGDNYLRDYSRNTRVFDSLGAELDGLARGGHSGGQQRQHRSRTKTRPSRSSCPPKASPHMTTTPGLLRPPPIPLLRKYL